MNKKILIIDDNPINNAKYIDVLKRDYDVSIAIWMRSALRLLKNSNWDIIVIDVMMPTQILSSDNEMRAGFEFYDSEIKKLNLSSKIIFWSRLTDSCFDQNKYPKSNGFYFVHKSEDANHLKIVIDKIFQP